MLYLVGLGLADETDITVKGLEVVKKCKRVYLEAYTSILTVGKQKLVSSFFFQFLSISIFAPTNKLVSFRGREKKTPLPAR